jgi:hypothetical protein
MVVARRNIGAAATIWVASAKGFAELVERHNGVWGGCWCMSFHPEGVRRDKSPRQNPAEKQRRVREGRAHAALVFDGITCVGWCQFGAPDSAEEEPLGRRHDRAAASLDPHPLASNDGLGIDARSEVDARHIEFAVRATAFGPA